MIEFTLNRNRNGKKSRWAKKYPRKRILKRGSEKAAGWYFHNWYDDGTKKSLKGLICVQGDGDKYVAEDQVSKEQEEKGYLQTVFEDGKLVKEWTLSEIRSAVDRSIVYEDI